MIKRNRFLISFGAPDPLRAWTDHAHVALEDIPKLRQLVEPHFPQPAPNTRYARIIFASVEVGRLLVQVLHEHRAELVCSENLTFAPDPQLSEDCGTATLHQNQ